MNNLRQVLVGILVALISFILVLGSASLALQEDGRALSAHLGSPEGQEGQETAPPQTLGAGDQSPNPIVPPTGTVSAPSKPSPVSIVCQAPESWEMYSVRVGDTVASLAIIYRVDPGAIMENNCLSVDDLKPGSTLFLPRLPETAASTAIPTVTKCSSPPGWVRYTVKQNDNMYRLSLAYGISVLELRIGNCQQTTFLRAGSTIYVPNVKPRVTATKKPRPTKTPKPTKTRTPVPSATLAPTLPQPTETSPPATPTPTEEIIRPTMTSTPEPPTATPTETLPPPSATATWTMTALPPTETETPIPTMTPTGTPTLPPSP